MAGIIVSGREQVVLTKTLLYLSRKLRTARDEGLKEMKPAETSLAQRVIIPQTAIPFTRWC